MVLRAEDAHELTAFSPLCIFCLVICPFDNRVESVKKVLNKQRCALFAIGQQSHYLNGIGGRAGILTGLFCQRSSARPWGGLHLRLQNSRAPIPSAL